ncbi:MAG TPA: hypothetical protein VK053_12635 [Jiangellaceae bacterium]|nr:hypothetical protein [Jiangellaceae bacterium]
MVRKAAGRIEHYLHPAGTTRDAGAALALIPADFHHRYGSPLDPHPSLSEGPLAGRRQCTSETCARAPRRAPHTGHLTRNRALADAVPLALAGCSEAADTAAADNVVSAPAVEDSVVNSALLANYGLEGMSDKEIVDHPGSVAPAGWPNSSLGACHRPSPHRRR